MNATTRRKPTGESVPQIPQSTPMQAGYGQPGHDFTLQAVMELQKSVGEMNANLKHLTVGVDQMRGDVANLIGWKNKILGGAAVVAVAGALVGYLISEMRQYVEFRAPTDKPALQSPAPEKRGAQQ